MTAPTPRTDRLWRAAPWLLLLVTALAYTQLLGVAFSWDDEALVVDNQLTSSLANAPEFFTRDLWSTTKLPWMRSGYYRPVLLLSLAVDRSLFGLSSAWAHFHSLLWHLGAVFGLFAVLRRVLAEAGGHDPDAGPPPPHVAALPALLGAALFALHPVQSEVLALVAARNDSMAAAMTLAALFLLLPARPKPAALVGAAALALTGLLSKESAVLAPALLLALDLGRWRRPKGWARYAALLAAVGAWYAMRAAAGVGAEISPADSSWALVGQRLHQVVAVYANLVVWPWPLSPARHLYYLPPMRELSFGLTVLALLIGAAVLRGKHRALVLVGLAWAGLTFAPSMAATLDKGLLGERYLYFPIAGLGLVLAAAVHTVPRWLLAGLAVPAIATLQLRLPQWLDSETVWSRAHEVAPSPFTAAGLGWYLHRDEDYDRALPLLVMALRENPPWTDVCDLLVMAHLNAGLPDEAARVGTWAIEERGCNPQGLITGQLAVALARTGKWETAVARARSRPGGLDRPASVVVAADAARRGDVATTLRMAEAHTGNPPFLYQVGKLLRLSGETDAGTLIDGIHSGEIKVVTAEEAAAMGVEGTPLPGSQGAAPPP